MEERRDRGILVLWLLTGLVLFAAGMNTCGTGAAQTDGSAEPTVVRLRSGGASYGPYNPWRHATIQPTDRGGFPADGTLLEQDASAYWWVTYVSGPDACIFTARPMADGELVAVGGGRDCNSEHGAHCGFFMPGHWWVYGASGGDCAAFGVEECTGWCQ